MEPARMRALSGVHVAMFERPFVAAGLTVSADCLNRPRKTPASNPSDSSASTSCLGAES